MRKQLHIILRLVMFCCILLFVSQEVSAQITFSVKNQTIRQTIRVIEKKADYSFFYTDKLPGLDQKISLTVSNESIDAVLEKVFKGSSISYKIESGKQVVLTLKSEQNAPQKGDKKTITGVVADRRGEPLIGVTVRVEGENIGTATDIDGRFSLEAPVGAKISFSYIGYVSQSHTVNKQNIYNVSLSEDSQVLEEVVVVGYGFMKRKDITTAVSVVSTADIEERPIMTAAQAIQGKAAGIQVVQPSGMPGSGVTIRVRGATSVQASQKLPAHCVLGVHPPRILVILGQSHCCQRAEAVRSSANTSHPYVFNQSFPGLGIRLYTLASQDSTFVLFSKTISISISVSGSLSRYVQEPNDTMPINPANIYFFKLMIVFF